MSDTDLYTFNQLEFSSFPVTWGIITIPEKMVIFRTGDKDPASESIPRWFADFDTAMIYKRSAPQRSFYVCGTSRRIRLVDLRVLKYIFMEDVLFKEKTFNPQDINLIKECLFAMGGLNFEDQWNLVKQLPYDLQCHFLHGKSDEVFIQYNQKKQGKGHRISVGDIDAKMVQLFKRIYGPGNGDVDGYIAPVISTPWHDRFHAEICLFDPASVFDKKDVTIYEDLPKELGFNFESVVDMARERLDQIWPPLNLGDMIRKDFQVIGPGPFHDYIKSGGVGETPFTCPIQTDPLQYFSDRDRGMDNLFKSSDLKIIDSLAEKVLDSSSLPSPVDVKVETEFQSEVDAKRDDSYDTSVEGVYGENMYRAPQPLTRRVKENANATLTSFDDPRISKLAQPGGRRSRAESNRSSSTHRNR